MENWDRVFLAGKESLVSCTDNNRKTIGCDTVCTHTLSLCLVLSNNTTHRSGSFLNNCFLCQLLKLKTSVFSALWMTSLYSTIVWSDFGLCWSALLIYFSFTMEWTVVPTWFIWGIYDGGRKGKKQAILRWSTDRGKIMNDYDHINYRFTYIIT